MDLQAFRGIADNTTVSDRKFVYFANGVEENGSQVAEFSKLCFNAAGKPREFKRPEGLDRQQSSIYMRSQLLSLVRDQLGGTESAAFKEIETKLFGKLSKSGQFDAKFAATPLRKRDIKAVFTTLDAAIATGPTGANAAPFAKMLNATGKFVVFGKNAKPELRKVVENGMAQSPIVSEKALNSSIMNQVGDGHEKAILGFLRNSDERNLPEIFNVDQNRMGCVSLPNGTRVRTVEDSGSGVEPDLEARHLSCEDLRNEIARAATGNPKAEFSKLTGTDLRKAQFFMANTCQGAALASANFINTRLMTENGLYLNAMASEGGSENIVYNMQQTKDGGIKFSATRYLRLTHVTDNTDLKFDPKKCYAAITWEVEYSAKKLDDIFAKKSDGTDRTWQDVDVTELRPDKQGGNFFMYID